MFSQYRLWSQHENPLPYNNNNNKDNNTVSFFTIAERSKPVPASVLLQGSSGTIYWQQLYWKRYSFCLPVLQVRQGPSYWSVRKGNYMSSFSFSVRRFFNRGAGNQHRCLNIFLILLNEDENPLRRKKEVALLAAVADANVSDANHGKADFDGFLMEVRSIKRNASSCNVTEKKYLQY